MNVKDNILKTISIIVFLIIVTGCSNKYKQENLKNIAVRYSSKMANEQNGTEQNEYTLKKKITDPNDPNNIPILYLPRLKPEPLNEENFGEIKKFFRNTGVIQNDIWYIEVGLSFYSREYEKDIFSLRIIAKPKSKDERVYEGIFWYFNDIANSVIETLSNEAKQRGNEGSQYVYISEPGVSFEFNKSPKISQTPFLRPEGISNENLTEIVDFLRTEDQQKEPHHVRVGNTNLFKTLIVRDITLPILEIKRNDETYDIKTGTIEGMGIGYGQKFKCQKIKGIWNIIGDIVDWYF